MQYFLIFGAYMGDFFILNEYPEKTAAATVVRACSRDNLIISATMGFCLHRAVFSFADRVRDPVARVLPR